MVDSPAGKWSSSVFHRIHVLSCRLSRCTGRLLRRDIFPVSGRLSYRPAVCTSGHPCFPRASGRCNPAPRECHCDRGRRDLVTPASGALLSRLRCASKPWRLEPSSDPHGPNRWFGGLNWSTTELYRQLVVGSEAKPFNYLVDWFIEPVRTNSQAVAGGPSGALEPRAAYSRWEQWIESGGKPRKNAYRLLCQCEVISATVEPCAEVKFRSQWTVSWNGLTVDHHIMESLLSSTSALDILVLCFALRAIPRTRHE